MNLYITGGHLTPALAVIDELQKKYPDVHIFFIGRDTSQALTKQPSHERKEVKARNIPFFAIDAAKFHRAQAWLNLFEIVKIIPSLIAVYLVFRKHRPDAILSFGGYLALPVCVVGKFLKARIVTHEQTKVAGLANQVLGHLADRIAVAHTESLQFFPKQKTVVTGNPIRSSLFREYKTPPKWLTGVSNEKPLLYVTGGSQGSQIINRTIAALLPRLVRDFVVVHQCGVTVDHHYVRDLEQEREKLSEELQLRYIVREWIEEKEVSYLFRHAKFVISRAGANTVQELMLAATPAIFIPLAFAYNDEQRANIEELVEHDASLCVLQKDLVPDALADAILEMEQKYEVIFANMKLAQETLIKDGTKRVIDLLEL